MSEFKEARRALQLEFRTSKYAIFDIIEKKWEEKDKFISEQIRSIKDMHHNFNYLIEYKEVLNKVSDFYNQSEQPIMQIARYSNTFRMKEETKSKRNSIADPFRGRTSDSSEEDKPIGEHGNIKSLNISTLAGTINIL